MSFLSKEYEFVAIGDIVVDDFIHLKEATVHPEANGFAELCMRFKEKIPYETHYVLPAVGNSPNAAVSAARLGLRTALVTNLGADHFGEECVKSLEKDGVKTEFVNRQKDKSTNYHFVLWFGDDRTILIKHEEYSYDLPKLGKPKWIYLSSLGEHTLDFHKKIEAYLVANPQVKLAFQPGTFQIRFGVEKIKDIYARTEVFFCNKEEAEEILNKETSDIETLARGIQALGPKIVVLTDGAAGAYVLKGNEMWRMPSYPDPKPPYERTGAGDAFSSTFTAALALGLPIEEALKWAPINAMSVVQCVGAQKGLLTRPELEKYLKEAPAGYAPEKLETHANVA